MRWLKGYINSSRYNHQFGSIILTHCFYIFPWICAGDVCYIIFCHLLHIHSRKTGILFSLLLCSLWCIIGYVLACRSYSFVCTLHHLIIIMVQTYLKALNLYNACQIYFVECVSKIEHILSDMHYTIYGTACFQFTHFPCDDRENIYTLSYDHHQIGSMNYHPLYRIRSWNSGMRCMFLYIPSMLLAISIYFAYKNVGFYYKNTALWRFPTHSDQDDLVTAHMHYTRKLLLEMRNIEMSSLSNFWALPRVRVWRQVGDEQLS